MIKHMDFFFYPVQWTVYHLSNMITIFSCSGFFFKEVNGRLGKKQIHTIDIGGGLPVSFYLKIIMV